MIAFPAYLTKFAINFCYCLMKFGRFRVLFIATKWQNVCFFHHWLIKIHNFLIKFTILFCSPLRKFVIYFWNLLTKFAVFFFFDLYTKFTIFSLWDWHNSQLFPVIIWVSLWLHVVNVWQNLWLNSGSELKYE